MSGYENEVSSPDYDTLAKIASLYGVTTDFLLGRSNVPFLNAPRKPTGNQTLAERLAAEGVALPAPQDTSDLIGRGPLRNIPIVAEIACGEPLFTEDSIIGWQAIDTGAVNLNGGEYVWLKAKGESMIDAGIRSGQLVLIRLQPEVEHGEIAAVCVDAENATLKTVMFDGDQIVLRPENKTMVPKTYDKARIRIVGKAVPLPFWSGV
ncbi:hypothetical protein JC200_03675 [Alicyclobacillus sp. ALC3]|nr:hypothetical protein JC200_03675 [Alicyclobacillus sp. ALC3]